jgi:hypothetical protein
VCEVDLSLDTADMDVHHDLIFGVVLDAESETATGDVALCLASRESMADAPSEPILVAYIEGGAGGLCASHDLEINYDYGQVISNPSSYQHNCDAYGNRRVGYWNWNGEWES